MGKAFGIGRGMRQLFTGRTHLGRLDRLEPVEPRQKPVNAFDFRHLIVMV
jgi:hypothetical protein